MRAQKVDPRYASSLEESPAYRVDFWVGTSGSEEWRLEGVRDVAEAMAWAATRARDRTFVLYAEYHDGPDVGLVRLFGEDPTSPSR